MVYSKSSFKKKLIKINAYFNKKINFRQTNKQKTPNFIPQGTRTRTKPKDRRKKKITTVRREKK